MSGCEKLLRKFLVRDPLKRPTLDILVDDTWLNDGYEASPVMQEINEENINEDALILSIIESKFGVPKDQMIKSLRENVYDETLAIYFMLWDEKRKNGEATVIKIGEQMAIKPGISGGQTASPKSEDLKHTPIGAIQEEGSGEVVTVIEPSRRRSTAAPQTPEITPKNGASAVPSSKVPVPNTANATVTPRVVQPVRRQRRFTVAGEAEMKKMAEEEKADPEILSKLRDLQVSKAEESIVNKAQDAEFAVRPRVHTGESRPRPVSIAATNDSHTTAMGSPQVQKATEKKSMSEEEKKAQATKKPSGITGFLKIRRNTVSTNGADQGRSTEVATTANGMDTSPVGEVKAASEESVSSTASGNGELKPRSLRFTFNSNTTSSKPPDDIVQEVPKTNFKNIQIFIYLIYNMAITLKNGCKSLYPNFQRTNEFLRIQYLY
jgi:MAP/microtubule affinity-regulating kinase